MIQFFGMGCLILGILLLIALIEVRNQRKINAIVMKQLVDTQQKEWRLKKELQKLNSRREVQGAQAIRDHLNT